MAEPIIEVRALTKDFEGIKAVDNLDLTIHRGEMVGIVGPDGAGKTTTLRMLCGVIEPTSGSVRILGYNLPADLNKLKKHIGYLSQRFSLYGDLSIDENIEFFAEIHGVRDYKARREELLSFTRLAPFRSRIAEKLSGGMKQKLALACALSHTPQLLLLDEPTTGVDPVSRRDFWKILSTLRAEGITIVMTTPYLDEAERCSRVGLMDKGRIMVMDEPHALKALMKGTVNEIVCGEVRRALAVVKAMPEVAEAQAFGDRLNIVVRDQERDVPRIRTLLREKGIEIAQWRPVPPSLENVFISLVRQSPPQGGKVDQ